MVGLADDRKGEAVAAFIAGDVDQTALAAACQDGLAAYKVPAAYRIEPTLPLTPAGKVVRLALRKLAAGEGAE